MQFGLRFHDQFKEGIFGKVTVCRREGDGTSKDVAEFLLQKVDSFLCVLSNFAWCYS